MQQVSQYRSKEKIGVMLIPKLHAARRVGYSPPLLQRLRYLIYQRVIWGISMTQIFPFYCL